MNGKARGKTAVTIMLFLTMVLARGLVAFADDPVDDSFGDDLPATVAPKDSFDPLEPLNRAFFRFNDKLYFWAIKPVAKGYGAVVPRDVRLCVRNAFSNLLTPVRLVNCLLQGKVKGAGIEVARFAINTSIGVLGLADPAKDKFDLRAQDEDLGQTLGYYGIGDKVYFCWPFFGPSNARDTVGAFGDIFLSPLGYLSYSDTETGIYVQSGQRVNQTSLTIGDYEQFLESTFDPYVAMREAYQQNRQAKIDDSGRDSGKKW